MQNPQPDTQYSNNGDPMVNSIDNSDIVDGNEVIDNSEERKRFIEEGTKNKSLKQLSDIESTEVIKKLNGYTLKEDDIVIDKEYLLDFEKGYSTFIETTKQEELITKSKEIAEKVGFKWEEVTEFIDLSSFDGLFKSIVNGLLESN
ncbi:hypothetical protein QTN25_001458 [Entamoeba marina]